MSIDNF